MEGGVVQNISVIEATRRAHGRRRANRPLSQFVVGTVILLALTGCGGEDPTPGAAPPSPEGTSDGATEAATAEPTAAPTSAGGGQGMCASFTAEDLTAAAGTQIAGAGFPLDPAGVSDMAGLFGIDVGDAAEGCEWVAPGGMSFVQVATIPPTAYDSLVERRRGQQGFEEVSGLGDRAYTFPDGQQGWTAHAVDGEDSVLLILGVDGVEKAAAVSLLKTALARR